MTYKFVILKFIYIYIYILVVIPKQYTDINQYQNISFFWPNRNDFRYDMDSLGIKAWQRQFIFLLFILFIIYLSSNGYWVQFWAVDLSSLLIIAVILSPLPQWARKFFIFKAMDHNGYETMILCTLTPYIYSQFQRVINLYIWY